MRESQLCYRCYYDPIHADNLCRFCLKADEQQARQEQAEEPQLQDEEADAEDGRLGCGEGDASDSRDLLATEGWFLPGGDSRASVMRPARRTVVTVPELLPGPGEAGYCVQQPPETTGHRSPKGRRMRRDEHVPIRECLTCGNPENDHPYRHPFYPKGIPARLEKIVVDPATCAECDQPKNKHLLGYQHPFMPKKGTNWDTFFLDLAEFYSQRSKDPSTKVGAVIVDDMRRVVGMGYNGFPRGVGDFPERLEDRPTKYAFMVHAEVNAILNAVGSTRGTTLYCTLFPCSDCAGPMIQAGVRRLVTVKCELARWDESHKIAQTMLEEAGVEILLVER